MTTTTRASKSPAPDGNVRSRRATLLHLWASASILVGAVLWWPVGFLGLEPWLHLPLKLAAGDALLLGATAAAATVSLVVRSPWPRLAIVLVFSALGWVLDGPASDDHPHERLVLLVLLAAGALLGILLGARGGKGFLAAATVLAVVAGLSPTNVPRGVALSLALALPFAVATWQRVAPTLVSLVRLVVTWLVFAVLARAFAHAWEQVHPGRGATPLGQQLRSVGSAAGDFIRTQGWDHAQELLRTSTGWYVVAAVLAVAFVVARTGRGALRRRTTKP